jgi:hypothetical protein
MTEPVLVIIDRRQTRAVRTDPGEGSSYDEKKVRDTFV